MKKNSLLQTYFGPPGGIAVETMISNLRLDNEKLDTLRQIIDGALTDAFHCRL
ncbi:MAG TPA: hypothetical protein VJ276_01500 [Thermoanaerobaculia bacterium]|nr:hypothetical protein [Thermoanaerobaculia bacterium]